MDEVDVVVVGAGLAGLTAARDLEAAGRSIVVLEARDRVGGRLLNHTFADGTVVELGGQWIGPTQHRVRALADELGLALFASYDDGESILELNGRQLRFADATFGLTGDVLQDVGTSRLRRRNSPRASSSTRLGPRPMRKRLTARRPTPGSSTTARRRRALGSGAR